VGPGSQNDYLNAVLELHTALDPLPLLDKLQALEHAAGRIRTVHWGPRTLDLDLLMAGDESLDHQRLQLPHPRMTERDFVLRPLADLLGPDWRLPDGRTLTDQLTHCADNNLRKTGFNWGESAAPQNARRA
jgi:2-amino-4-hydroxy-6-hydroxymethyldihydropteridine diphosphokinase